MENVDKALFLRGHFFSDREMIRLNELTRLSGMNKAAAHRMMTELAGEGFVEQAGAGRSYR